MLEDNYAEHTDCELGKRDFTFSDYNSCHSSGEPERISDIRFVHLPCLLRKRVSHRQSGRVFDFKCSMTLALSIPHVIPIDTPGAWVPEVAVRHCYVHF